MYESKMHVFTIILGYDEVKKVSRPISSKPLESVNVFQMSKQHARLVKKKELTKHMR